MSGKKVVASWNQVLWNTTISDEPLEIFIGMPLVFSPTVTDQPDREVVEKCNQIDNSSST